MAPAAGGRTFAACARWSRATAGSARSHAPRCGPGQPTGRLVPESHARGNERIASVALLGGFALMMTLDNAFG
jgi:hypothetical protein